MRQCLTYGSVRGAARKRRFYRDLLQRPLVRGFPLAARPTRYVLARVS